MGIASVVGRPLLYQACASAPAPSLTGRGEQRTGWGQLGWAAPLRFCVP